MSDIAVRFGNNPLITPKDVTPSQDDLEIVCVMNPGAFVFDNKTWLIARVAEKPFQSEGMVALPILEEGKVKIIRFDKDDPAIDLSDPRYVIYHGECYLSTLSHLRIFCSDDSVHFYEPTDYPTRLFGMDPLETYGIEDCRVTQIAGTYYLTFTKVSSHGVGVGLMQTRDWKKIERNGMILPPHNKDCAIFNEKINGKYYCLNRPSGLTLGGHYIWISTSREMKFWGEHQCILHTREKMWDCERVGAGAAPIKTPEGWLVIYHGADDVHRYCLGAVLLDLKNPERVLARTSNPIMEPTESYEKRGFFNDVIFTNGHLVDHDRITMYYGACDEVICGAEFSINEIFSQLSHL
jgi:predicted GH43/DUF377 family glycosyl hydrolase